MTISKKTRFEVFKRDGFRCGYCGGIPPKVTLEVDHIEPVSKGGLDDPINLITACFECNRGKGAVRLDQLPLSQKYEVEILIEKEEQAREYHKYVGIREQRINEEIDMVLHILQSIERGGIYKLGNNKERQSIKTFLKQLSFDEVFEAAEIAISRQHTQWYAFKYFCGICWRKIKGDGKK